MAAVDRGQSDTAAAGTRPSAERGGHAGGYFSIDEPFRGVAARLLAKFGFEEVRRIRIPEDKLTDEDRAMAPDRPVHAVVLELTPERWEAGQE